MDFYPPLKFWIYSILGIMLIGIVLDLFGVLYPYWLFVRCNEGHLDVGLWKVCYSGLSEEYLNKIHEQFEVSFMVDKECLYYTDELQPTWLTASQLLNCGGLVASGITIILTFLYSLLPYEVAIQSANGLGAACMCSASFVIVGAFTVSEGRASTETAFKDICDVVSVEFDHSWALSIWAFSLYLVAGIAGISSALMMAPIADKSTKSDDSGMSAAERHRKNRPKISI